jgi:phage baseplate assembly protein gpV
MAEENHAQPSRDPANDASLLGMARQILDKFLMGVDDMLPARVVSYDRAKNRATVVPMVMMLTTDNRQVGRAQIASVPVLRIGGGGMALSFNLKAGDLGWIKANDRDISLITQGYKDAAPNTLRKHSFQDAVFIPDVMTGLTVPGEDSDAAVLQTLDGSVKVSVGADKVKIASGASSIVVSASGIAIVGDVTITGKLTTSGASTLSGGATIGGISFASHKHSGVQPGGGQSGGPV